jgi:thioredoxin 1|tara:strand:- start:45 stop:365 length:321 start_codon:yes stop_codon:yes gene_type:complete
MATKKITDESFETDVIKAAKPTIVDFWAEWCGPCKQIASVLEEISDEMKDQVVIAKHNIDEEPNSPTKYGIRGIPTMLLFKDGQLKATKVGATTKSNIVSWIKENI